MFNKKKNKIKELTKARDHVVEENVKLREEKTKLNKEYILLGESCTTIIEENKKLKRGLKEERNKMKHYSLELGKLQSKIEAHILELEAKYEL